MRTLEVFVGLSISMVVLFFLSTPAQELLTERATTLGSAHLVSRFETRLDVLSDPPGAQLFIDGRYVGTTPARAVPLVFKDEAPVVLKLKRRGYQDLTQKVRVSPSVKHGTLKLALEK